jgi:hypothetical protein
MAVIDFSGAENVTILATVDGGGGDWTPDREVYPVILGWGAELSAPGVYFLGDGGLLSILDVEVYPNDKLGYASVVGSATSQVGVGVNQANDTVTSEGEAIAIQNGATLYIADAVVVPAQQFAGVGIYVNAGGGLVLGQDQSGGITGTVNIGRWSTNLADDGYAGIWCNSDGVSLGCTINDVPLVGQSSVVIQGQIYDILALDFSSVSLTSAPVFGPAPVATGWYQCPLDPKNDFNGVTVAGSATLNLSNATIQCQGYEGVHIDFSVFGLVNNGPTVSVDHTLIQNVGEGFYLSTGTATVSNTMMRFNHFGVEEYGGNIDLSGAGVGGNTIVCSSRAEWGPSGAGLYPGVDVYLSGGTANLNAEDVTWDTTGPDYFSEYWDGKGGDFFTCRNSSCTVDGGSDDMNAVSSQWPDAGIITTGNLYWDGGCGL